MGVEVECYNAANPKMASLKSEVNVGFSLVSDLVELVLHILNHHRDELLLGLGQFVPVRQDLLDVRVLGLDDPKLSVDVLFCRGLLDDQYPLSHLGLGELLVTT